MISSFVILKFWSSGTNSRQGGLVFTTWPSNALLLIILMIRQPGQTQKMLRQQNTVTVRKSKSPYQTILANLRRKKLGLRKYPWLVQDTNFSSRFFGQRPSKENWMIDCSLLFCCQPSKTASDCSSCHRCARQGRTGDPIQHLQVKHSSDWKYKSWYGWKAAQRRNLISDCYSCESQRTD